MYAETGLLHPYFQDFCQEIQLLELDDLRHSQKSRSAMSSPVSEYDMGGEGGIFKAPEQIMDEKVVSFNPIIEVMPTQGLTIEEVDSLQDEQLLNEFLYEPKKDFSENVLGEMPVIEVQTEEKNLVDESAFQKSDSSGCLSSNEWSLLKPGFLDFSELDFADDYGMRRAFSEGDIKALGNGNINLIHSPAHRPLGIVSCSAEDRQQKLCRYREKKSRRNFGRKIKYACRKALADNQPRIRGRFAKTEERC